MPLYGFVVRVLPWLAVASLGGVGVAGCTEAPVSMAAGPREYVPSDYPQVLKTWTRDESLVVFSELEHKLTVTATFESWDFRWAYVVRYAADYRLTVEERRALLERTLQESQTDHEFYVALYGPNWRWTDISRPTSAWIVRLIDDEGDETAPSSIQAIVKPGPLEQRYFPYTSVWRQAFRIRFPRSTPDGRPTIATQAKWFGLRFAGAEGSKELQWKIEPGTLAPPVERPASGPSSSISTEGESASSTSGAASSSNRAASSSSGPASSSSGSTGASSSAPK